MRLELDLTSDAWRDYGESPDGDLARVGVGEAGLIRLGIVVDGQRLVAMTPWRIWQAANEALAPHMGEPAAQLPPAAEPPPPTSPAVDFQEAIRVHDARWGLAASHLDGTDGDEWSGPAMSARADATDAAMSGEITWAHTLLEAAYAALATEGPADLRDALARVAGCAASWMSAIDQRGADA